MSSKDHLDLEIKDEFKTGENWWHRNKNFKEKKIKFAFHPSSEEREAWITEGKPRLAGLLTYLKNAHGGLTKFELIFFRKNMSESFYIKEQAGVVNIYVNLDRHQEYASSISSVMEKLKIFRYHMKIQIEYSKKTATAFFNNEPAKSVIDDLKRSHYKVIEDLINRYECLDYVEKKNIKLVFQNSTLADDAVKYFKTLKTGSPKRQLRHFLKNINKFDDKEKDVISKKMAGSDSIMEKMIEHSRELSPKMYKKLVENIQDGAEMYIRYERLQNSLKEFKQKIKDHNESSKKDEKDIHKFLVEHPWLLGIEYFRAKIKSDIDKDGRRTGATNIGRKRADFIILHRLDGKDGCTVIEIEEANDRIFNKDGTVSKDVYDGIIQAVDYNIELNAGKRHSKGMAVIGSLKNIKGKKEEKRLELLRAEFPNIEILTYEQLISKAKVTLEFWKEYEAS